jgi:galactokinase
MVSRTMNDLNTLKEQFARTFDASADGAVRAPGRVNLIGEHTDYNDGYVLPIAIEKQTVALWRKRDDLTVRFRSLQQGAEMSIDLADEETLTPGETKWANYPLGVAAKLFEHGVALSGAEILFDSDVPLGGGLSSSASLEVATALALLEASNNRDQIDEMTLAKLCQSAEHEFANSPCGIMDQAIAILGQAGHALLLDCFDESTKQIPFDDPDYVLLVADTEVKHGIGDGEYARRREECKKAAAMLDVPALRAASQEAVEAAAVDGRLAKPEYQRARHVTGEIRRTLEAAEALGNRDYETFGKLMIESHESLRDDYEVSCEELDVLVDLARKQDGVFGARMTGGGFGGCMIVLAAATHADAITAALADGFHERFGRRCPVFVTRPADGAGVVE